MRRRGELNFRMEIFTNITRGQKDEFGKLLPDLALLTARNIREYFYAKIRSSMPTLSAFLGLAGQICLS